MIARVLQERPPFLGEFEPARGPAQQRGLELLLEPRERTARGRHGQVEPLRGSGDRAGVDHGSKGLEFVERDLHY
jgi:hypothetical protein